MIEVKEAVKIATDFVNNVLSEEKFDRITLEEVELSEDSSYWYVTIGLGKIVTEGPFEALAGRSKLSVKYRIFKIEIKTGRVVSMKMRDE